MAYAYKSMDNGKKASEAAKTAYDLAQKTGNAEWKMNTSLLLASLSGIISKYKHFLKK